MEFEQWSPAAALKWVAAFFAAWWFNLPEGARTAMTTLMLLMAIDIVTGLWAALAQKALTSDKGWRGISRKLGVICFLIFAHFLEKAVNIELNLEIAGAIAYSVTECISIVENFSFIGVPIPAQLVAALLQAKKLRPAPATADEIRKLSDGEQEHQP